MIHNYIAKRKAHLVGTQVTSFLAYDVKSVNMRNVCLLHSSKTLSTQKSIMSFKHENAIQYHHNNKLMSNINSLTHKSRYLFSTSSSTPNQRIDYNQFTTIRELSNLSTSNNRFHSTHQSSTFLSNQYSTISLQIQKKLQKIEGILHSPEKNLYKIVEEAIIVLQAFANLNRRQILEQNVVKVIKQFGKKLVSAYLETLQTQELQQLEAKKSQAKYEPLEQTDSNYSLHDNYPTPLEGTQFVPIVTRSTVDVNFILFYIETIKTWLLSKVDNDQLIRQAEEKMFDIFKVREVSALNDTLRQSVDNLIENYIEEESIKKREMFPFELKLRGLCLLPFFETKTYIEKYFQRLAEENLSIYLKQSQILTLMYDITELRPTLSECTQFIYQIQSTRIYQIMSAINMAYIKALFIEYTRKFMVSYQEIQFYELFRDIEPRIRYPTIRTFIRLVRILNVEAADLHCEYNKTMNKYNYNIIISVVMSQNYSPENCKFQQLMELFEELNAYEQCGEVLYEELGKFIKTFNTKQQNSKVLKPQELDKIYKLFQHVLTESKPIFKYEEKQTLNREYSRKTTQLLSILFDTLIETHPQVVVEGRKFIRSYVLFEESNVLSAASVPFDDRDIRFDMGHAQTTKNKIEKVKLAYSKVAAQVKDMHPKKLGQFLESVNSFSQISVQCLKSNETQEQYPIKSQPQTSLPQSSKLLAIIYPCLADHSFELTLLRQTIEPIIMQYLDLASKDMIKKLSNQQFRQLYRNLYLSLSALNSVNFEKEVASVMEGYVEQLRRKVLYEMKFGMDLYERDAELKRTTGIQKMQISTPKGNIELLLTIHQLIKLTQKLQSSNQQTKTQQHLSSTSSPHSLQTLIVSLPLIYNFINKIAIKNFKGIQEQDLISMIMLLKTLEEIKAEQKKNVLLLEINPLVWEYLYQSMSVYLMYLSDKGKTFLKLTNTTAEQFIKIINHFVGNKETFKALPSKKRLVPLQVILFGLVRRKYIKLTSSHMKRSQSMKILLTFLQIFEYPENLTFDMKKLIEETEFMTGELEQIPIQILERFGEHNWSIGRFLEDSNLSLSSVKKLGKMSPQELRKEFDEKKTSPKMYEMILKNPKLSLPFVLPQPKNDHVNSKIWYVLEKIYQKISKKNNYLVKKQRKSSQKEQQTSSRRNGKTTVEQQVILAQNDQDNSQILKQQFDVISVQQNFFDINLEQEKQYIKNESLVNYTYENHYKLNSNKLPINFKRESWKNLQNVSRQLEIESLEIDQKIDETIYKQVLLATFGYVEKVKLIAKEFHAHSFIQYYAALLDMEVYFHGCIARISRKNKPEENILLVCAIESNYKLLYICTHILRESGENAYIVMDKTKETDFKEFLERMLPQPFEAEETEIVDKVVKGQIENE